MRRREDNKHNSANDHEECGTFVTIVGDVFDFVINHNPDGNERADGGNVGGVRAQLQGGEEQQEADNTVDGEEERGFEHFWREEGFVWPDAQGRDEQKGCGADQACGEHDVGVS